MIKVRIKAHGRPVLVWEAGKVAGPHVWVMFVKTRADMEAAGGGICIPGFGQISGDPLDTREGFLGLLALAFPGGYDVIKDTEQRVKYPDDAVF